MSISFLKFEGFWPLVFKIAFFSFCTPLLRFPYYWSIWWPTLSPSNFSFFFLFFQLDNFKWHFFAFTHFFLMLANLLLNPSSQFFSSAVVLKLQLQVFSLVIFYTSLGWDSHFVRHCYHELTEYFYDSYLEFSVW